MGGCGVGRRYCRCCGFLKSLVTGLRVSGTAVYICKTSTSGGHERILRLFRVVGELGRSQDSEMAH